MLMPGGNATTPESRRDGTFLLGHNIFRPNIMGVSSLARLGL